MQFNAENEVNEFVCCMMLKSRELVSYCWGVSDAVATVDCGLLPDRLLRGLVPLDRPFLAVPALVRCASLDPKQAKINPTFQT